MKNSWLWECREDRRFFSNDLENFNKREQSHDNRTVYIMSHYDDIHLFGTVTLSFVLLLTIFVFFVEYSRIL